jgi:hypothetical protein
MWFNANNDGQLFWTGINDNSGDRLNIFFSEDGGLGGNTTTPQINYTFKGHTHYANVNPNQWHHLVCTYSGTDSSSRKIYIDGVPAGSDDITDGSRPSGDAHALNIQTSTFYLNKTDYGSGSLVGSISQFKLYDVALTAQEVKTLYDMGRCDEGGHVVNFSKTRVGIGLGDGEAPQAALDVRGDIYGGCPVYFSVRCTTNAPAGIIPWNIIMTSRGGGFNTSNGLFTVPLSGVYSFSYALRERNSDANIYTNLQINGVDDTTARTYHRSNYSMSSITFIRRMTKGDTIAIELNAGDMASSYNQFTGQYISSV